MTQQQEELAEMLAREKAQDKARKVEKEQRDKVLAEFDFSQIIRL